MFKTALKTTSALALCAGLITPPAAAQQSKADLPLCALDGGDSAFPCVLEDGKRVKGPKALAKALADRATRAGTEKVTTQQPGAVTAPPAQQRKADLPLCALDGGDSAFPCVLEDGKRVKGPKALAKALADQDSRARTEKVTTQQPGAVAAPAAAPKAEGQRARTQVAAAAAAAAALNDDDMFEDTATGRVTTERVTTATTRSSAQDFSPSSGGAEVTARQGSAGGGGDNDGFQKGLLIGLGALAVGAILYNGAKVVSNSGDRVVVEEPDGTLTVLKNDDEILRRPGSEVRTQTFDDGSTRTVVTRENGVRIITVRAADGTALKRVRVLPNGDRYVLFDDTVEVAPVEVLPTPQPAAAGIEATDQDALRAALIASMADRGGRSYGLNQVRRIQEVRALAPEIEVRAITFRTGSAAIPPAQAERLADLGRAIAEVIVAVPGAVFLVEGHTDAVGSSASNLALSDRRAESVALALGEYFGVPPENLVTQGYGESDLKVDTEEANRQNRRVVVRNITPLLR